MAREWHRGSIELRDGYTIMDGDGKMAHQIPNAKFSIEGGFLYVDVHGADDLQVVSSEAVRLLTYQRKTRE